MHNELLTKIVKLLHKAPLMAAGNIKEETELRSIQGWDSLKHLMLLMEIEKEFSIEIDPEAINKIITVKDLLNLIKKDGNP